MNKSKTKSMNYEEWTASHPIRVWARDKGVGLSALAALLRVSPQTLNDWLRGGGVSILEQAAAPYDPRVIKLALRMGTTPEALGKAIAEWRDQGEQLSI